MTPTGVTSSSNATSGTGAVTLIVTTRSVRIPRVDAVDLGWAPADRIIVATARRLGASLVTFDAAILEFAAATRSVRVIEV